MYFYGIYFQLPPVGYPKKCGYAFESLSYKHAKMFGPLQRLAEPWKDFQYIELTENKRQQTDAVFADLLKSMRHGTMTPEMTKLLADRVLPTPADADNPKLASLQAAADKFTELRQVNQTPPLCLFPTNSSADELNELLLQREGNEIVQLPAADSNQRKAKVNAIVTGVSVVFR